MYIFYNIPQQMKYSLGNIIKSYQIFNKSNELYHHCNDHENMEDEMAVAFFLADLVKHSTYRIGHPASQDQQETRPCQSLEGWFQTDDHAPPHA